VNVLVAVLTYRRPADLAALLPMLADQLGRVAADAHVLVVDNDPDGGAAGLVESFGDVRFRYVHEARPGIAPARNRALAEAGDADLLVFIDDDERPVDAWLPALLATYEATRPDAVVGPVSSTFTGELDPWIAAGGFFTRRRLATGTEVAVAATNNLLLDLERVRARDLRFDEALGLIGGEDTLFTREITSDGGRIVWCAEAMVHDVVPAERMTRRWVVKRAFRMGGSASQVELRVAGSAPGRAKVRTRQVLLGASRLGGGAVRYAAGCLTLSAGRRAAGVRNLARGSGLVLGAFGYVQQEYRRQASPTSVPTR
jgi:succinoglycan biosynthesis protein ExoM